MIEPRYLLDTNVCIYLLEGDAPSLRTRVEQCAPGELVTSSIAYGEVLVGAQRTGASLRTTRFFEVVPPLPFDASAAEAYATLRFRRGSFDRLIAGHAKALGLTLITNNEADFADVAGLRVENWMR